MRLYFLLAVLCSCLLLPGCGWPGRTAGPTVTVRAVTAEPARESQDGAMWRVTADLLGNIVQIVGASIEPLTLAIPVLGSLGSEAIRTAGDSKVRVTTLTVPLHEADAADVTIRLDGGGTIWAHVQPVWFARPPKE